MCSIISEKPGPEVTVKALAPPHTAPCNVIEAASSSSIWINVPPTVGTRDAKRSTTSVEGVIGYPAAKRAPAANAPSQQAWSPSMKCTPVSTPRGSAFTSGLRHFVAADGEIGAEHAAQVAAAAFFRVHHVRGMVSLGVEGGRKLQNLGRAEFNAKSACLAALDDNGNSSFSQETPTFGAERSTHP